MADIKTIIVEEALKLLKEIYGDIYDLYEERDNAVRDILSDFLYENNPQFTKRIPWRVVPAARLKKIWEDYIRVGVVRDKKGMDMIAVIMIGNAIKLEVSTMLSGHSQDNPDEYFEDSWGDYIRDYAGRVFQNANPDFKPEEFYSKIPNEVFANYIRGIDDEISFEQLQKELMEVLQDTFYNNYLIDSKGREILSDYGTQPLMELALKLAAEDNAEKKVVIVDQMLNVVHQRSDLAFWFIEGGSSALSDISGYDLPADENSWYRSKSAVSGVNR